jgi:flagellar motor switch/type III secretory pathway protein FliN
MDSVDLCNYIQSKTLIEEALFDKSIKIKLLKENRDRVVINKDALLVLYPKSLCDFSNIDSGKIIKLNSGKFLQVRFIRNTGDIEMELKVGSPSSENLDNLFLPIHLVIKKMEISVREILELKEDKLISIDMPVNNSVDIYLGGENIGHASIFKDGEEYFLKINSVFMQKNETNSDNSLDAERGSDLI